MLKHNLALKTVQQHFVDQLRRRNSMKYSIKPKNDSDKENAKQLELIMNHKLATYDDISEVIKERVDNFEFRKPCIIRGSELLISKTESEIISFDQ